jgi:hypothetical protein
MAGRRSSRRGQYIPARHDDPRLGPYSPGGSVIRCAVELASDVRGLELVLRACVGDRYVVKVIERTDGVHSALADELAAAMFDPHEYRELQATPAAYPRYLRAQVERGWRPLMFPKIPHVLVAGEIDTTGLDKGWAS